MAHRDSVSTIMFYLHIVILTNKSDKMRIKHSFDVRTY